jgi:hypothetical protein
MFYTTFLIDSQNDHCGPALRADSDKCCIRIDMKMIIPRLLAGIVQSGCFAGCRIKCSHIRSLEAVALQAGETQIAGVIAATVLKGDNVINLKR